MSSQSENERQLRRFAEDLPGALYAGPRRAEDPGGWSMWHVVSVLHPKGRSQAIYCKTQDQAETIAALAQYAERTINATPEADQEDALREVRNPDS